MRKLWLQMAVSVFVVSVAGCSNISGLIKPDDSKGGSEGQAKTVGTVVETSGEETKVNITMTGGGEIGLKSMSTSDKLKMSRALDAGIGKSTTWKNSATGISYTVVPSRKVVIQNNPFCREYQVTMTKNQSQQALRGTACITDDGNWHTI
jgi:surface antigen